MSEANGWGNSAASRAGTRPQGDAVPPSVGISAYRDVTLNDSKIAGRDINETTTNTTINKHRSFQLGLGAVALAVVVSAGYGIVHLATSSSNSSSESVVYTAGPQGAVGTIEQIQQTEESGDASQWCFLASSSDSSTCQDLLSNSYSTANSAAIRNQISAIRIGQPSGSGDSYTFDLTYEGHSYPGVQFQWTGERWELSSAYYILCLNNGGLFASVIEAAEGKSAIFGIVG